MLHDVVCVPLSAPSLHDEYITVASLYHRIEGEVPSKSSLLSRSPQFNDVAERTLGLLEAASMATQQQAKVLCSIV